MFLGSKVWLVRGADNLTAVYESIVYMPPRPVMGTALLFYYTQNSRHAFVCGLFNDPLNSLYCKASMINEK
jgi:hypothetical protein